MKLLTAILLSALTLSANTIVSLEGTTGQTDAQGTLVGPYSLLVDGATTQAFCFTSWKENYVGQQWTADVFNGADLAGSEYTAAQLDPIFAIAGLILAGQVDAALGQDAIWNELASYTVPSPAIASVVSEALANPVDPSQWELVQAQGPEQDFVIPSPSVPEPGNLAMLLMAVGCFAIRARRRV